MSQDAKFEDVKERAVNLHSVDADDLAVISTLCQDAVLPGSEISWRPDEHRFAMLLNRFPWEAKNPTPERVQSVLVFDDVSKVEQHGIGFPTDLILSVLTLNFTPAEDGAGVIDIQLAGNGEIRLHVECINAQLRDMSKPYTAISGQQPTHPLD